MEQKKKQHFFPNAVRSLLYIQFVAVAFQLWRSSPLTYYGPALDLPLGGFGPKVNKNERGLEYFIPTKFGEYPSSDLNLHFMHSPTYKDGNYTKLMQINFLSHKNLSKLH